MNSEYSDKKLLSKDLQEDGMPLYVASEAFLDQGIYGLIDKAFQS